MYRLGLNTGFAVNRFPEPEEWTKLVHEVGINYVQFTADMLNVSLPDEIVQEQMGRINEACNLYNIEIGSTFTGAFTRVNHLAHPDKVVREYWIHWFKKFVDLTIGMGSKVMGSHFGILSAKDDNDLTRRKERVKQNIDAWHEIAVYAKDRGIDCIIWEPMSISREQGETIERCRELQEMVNLNAPLPFKICLDVDHGDLSSKNPNDTDPYAWLDEFAEDSPVIHLKQSLMDKGGHWPFTKQYNEKGKIIPEKVIGMLERKGIKDVDLVLELSFRERQPADSTVFEVLKESVDYWKVALN
jgi:sugar phosphate isomerase/epimerase